MNDNGATNSDTLGFSHSFDLAYGSASFYYGLKPLSALVRQLDDRSFGPRELALDLGCGEGRDSIYLAKKGISVVALDFSQVGISKLQAVAAVATLPISARVADVVTYDFPPETFSVVLARTLLCHLTQDNLKTVMSGVTRTLVPGGLFFASVFTTEDPGSRRELEHASECARYVRHYFQPGELRHLVGNWTILEYEEKVSTDLSHGPPHEHGTAHIVARKPDLR